jgi:hypothetical protein
VSAAARLRIMDLPGLAQGAKRLEVGCRYSTTGLTSVPGAGNDLTQEMLVLVAGYAHEGRCGECDISRVLDRGDREVRKLTERTWAEFQGAMLTAGRRN